MLAPFENYYKNSSGNEAVTDVGVFFGIEREVLSKLWMQLGVSGYVDESIKRKGTVWQFGLPIFADLSYQYAIKSTRVLFESKLLTVISAYPKFKPYFSYSLGTAYNNSHDYQESALVTGAVPTSPFINHQKLSFTWGVGVGFEQQINSSWRLGLGYQFADLGSYSLGPTAAATTKATLNFPHLYDNQLRFQFTLII